jgi:hypothetical protein
VCFWKKKPVHPDRPVHPAWQYAVARAAVIGAPYLGLASHTPLLQRSVSEI